MYDSLTDNQIIKVRMTFMVSTDPDQVQYYYINPNKNCKIHFERFSGTFYSWVIWRSTGILPFPSKLKKRGPIFIISYTSFFLFGNEVVQRDQRSSTSGRADFTFSLLSYTLPVVLPGPECRV